MIDPDHFGESQTPQKSLKDISDNFEIPTSRFKNQKQANVPMYVKKVLQPLTENQEILQESSLDVFDDFVSNELKTKIKLNGFMNYSKIMWSGKTTFYVMSNNLKISYLNSLMLLSFYIPPYFLGSNFWLKQNCINQYISASLFYIENEITNDVSCGIAICNSSCSK